MLQEGLVTYVEVAYLLCEQQQCLLFRRKG